MEVTAIRPDRDVIGKQKNPRKKKMLLLQQQQTSKSLDSGSVGIGGSIMTSNGGVGIKGEGGGAAGESCCLPSPGTESNGSVFSNYPRITGNRARISILNIRPFLCL
jgi:hypothetical protein